MFGGQHGTYAHDCSHRYFHCKQLAEQIESSHRSIYHYWPQMIYRLVVGNGRLTHIPKATRDGKRTTKCCRTNVEKAKYTHTQQGIIQTWFLWRFIFMCTHKQHSSNAVKNWPCMYLSHIRLFASVFLQYFYFISWCMFVSVGVSFFFFFIS